jgi:hypothetical protein
MKDLFLYFVISQVIVQLALYYPFHELHKIVINNTSNTKTTLKVLSFASIVENLILTIIVLKITNSGALAGTANLLGSTIVGFIATGDNLLLAFKKYWRNRKKTTTGGMELC